MKPSMQFNVAVYTATVQSLFTGDYDMTDTQKARRAWEMVQTTWNEMPDEMKAELYSCDADYDSVQDLAVGQLAELNERQ